MKKNVQSKWQQNNYLVSCKVFFSGFKVLLWMFTFFLDWYWCAKYLVTFILIVVIGFCSDICTELMIYIFKIYETPAESATFFAFCLQFVSWNLCGLMWNSKMERKCVNYVFLFVQVFFLFCLHFWLFYFLIDLRHSWLFFIFSAFHSLESSVRRRKMLMTPWSLGEKSMSTLTKVRKIAFEKTNRNTDMYTNCF